MEDAKNAIVAVLSMFGAILFYFGGVVLGIVAFAAAYHGVILLLDWAFEVLSS